MPAWTKTALAVVVALAGAALAVRGFLPTRSERTDTPKPRLVTADGSVPEPVRRERPPVDLDALGWVENGETSYAFDRIKNDEQARELAASIGTAIDTTKPGVGGSVAAFLEPVLTSDGDLDAAISALGGNSEEPAVGVRSMLAALLEHAAADPTQIEITEPDEDPTAVGGISINRNSQQEEGGESLDITTLSSSFERYFPDALGEDASGELTQVRIPMRSDSAEQDAPDMWLTMQLRYNAAAGRWQPAAAQLASTSPDVMTRVRTAMTALQRDGATRTTRGGG